MLSPLEQAIGMPLGATSPLAELGSAPAGSPWDALLESFTEILQHPPVLLAFSGGRDSSLLLAAAIACARDHGLPAPIPITYRNVGAPGMQEDAWQELAIERFAVADWERVEGLGELDFLGPLAREALIRHGEARYTPNAHFVIPLARQAKGGTLVLGLGGDELLAGWRWVERADILARRAPLRRTSLGTLLLGSAPSATRRMLFERRLEALDSPWVTPQAKHLLGHWAGELEDQPTRWDSFVRWSLRRRRLTVTVQTLMSLTHAQGAQLSLPLLGPAFLRALAHAGGEHGWSGRTAAMRAIAEGHVPAETIERRSKAHFDEVYWGPESRAFATRWSGELPHPDLVDAERLREEWLSERPRARSALLMQASWLRENVINTEYGYDNGALHRH